MSYRLLGLSVATLFVVVAFVACSPFGASDDSLLKQICDNTKKPSKRLTTVDELQQLAEGDLSSCSDRIKSAIVDLNNLIHDHQANVCSQESANAIADYYGQYLANKDASTNTLIEYPKAMKKFFISYGLKVSSYCRKQAIDLLIGDSQSLVEPSDFHELSEFSGEKGYIAIFMNDPSAYDDLVLPKMFIKMMDSFGKMDTTEDDKVFLELATTKRIKRLQGVCDRRFRPIYKDLILPLVTLASAGFNYKGEDLKRDPEVNKQIYEWYRIVFLCESMNGLELFQMPEDEVKAAGSSRQLVRILDKKEADKLRQSSPATEETLLDDLQQVEYQPKVQPMPSTGVIYDGKDSDLKKAVMAFKRHSRKVNDPDLARRMINVAKDKFNKGGIKIIKKLTGLKSLPSNGELSNVDMIKFLDEYVHAMETGDSKAVAGVMGNGKGALGSDTQWRWLIRHSWVAVVIAIFVIAGVCIVTGHG